MGSVDLAVRSDCRPEKGPELVNRAGGVTQIHRGELSEQGVLLVSHEHVLFGSNPGFKPLS